MLMLKKKNLDEYIKYKIKKFQKDPQNRQLLKEHVQDIKIQRIRERQAHKE